MDRSEGWRVTYYDRSHRTARTEYETIPVDMLLGRMGPQVMPKGCKRIRSEGGQATQTFAKVKIMIQTALAKVEELGKGAGKSIARLTYRQRYAQSPGRAPFRGPHGQREMQLWGIWHPPYGVSYAEGEVIQRGT
jgi:hypothetical protein